MSSATVNPAIPPVRGHFIAAFVELLLRDLGVVRREIGPFLLRVALQPLLFLFVFTYLFPRIGQANPMAVGGVNNFGTVLLPGLIAVAIMVSGIAAVALPLAQQFEPQRKTPGGSLSPLPVAAVAFEKVCFGALHSMMAAILIFPLAYFIPRAAVHVHLESLPLFAGVMVLAGLIAGSLGLAAGSRLKPQQIGLILSTVAVPMTFLGCVYYPWEYLDHTRWLQIAVLLNPIVYLSEGLRAALTPTVPHMSQAPLLAAMAASLAVFGWLGFRGLRKRMIA